MKSSIHDILPPKVRRSLTKLGSDIATARRKRHLTVAMMAERLGVAKSTYLRVEQGNPSVSVSVYAMALFALGLGDVLGQIIDPSRDDQGLLLDEQRLPKRVRVKKEPENL
jgi:transcriptional regulator with XRE-family HTH domain